MIQLGIDSFLKNKTKFKGKRIGLLVHAASVDAKLCHTLDLFLEAKLNVVRLFGPEHGLWATAQDMIGVNSNVDARTGIPIVSLYGKDFDSLKPKPEDLADLDLLVCDLQDIGTRFYTFAATVYLCMKEAAKIGLPVHVLDRPNPINGIDLEGPMLQTGFESFVGLYPIPVRHGMTLGELALFWHKTESINVPLTVHKMKGWKRSQYFDETGLPWVLPSPNMPTLETALVYPGLCLLEATHLSEGRGTTRPFELIGAPYINPFDWAKKLDSYKLPGIAFRPCHFHPMHQKWAGVDCGGVQLHITNRKKFKPYLTALAILHSAHSLYPNQLEWRHEPYEFVKEIPAIDLLTGSPVFRKKLEKKTAFSELKKDAELGVKEFAKIRKQFLLYS